MLSARGGAKASSISRIRSGWKKFRVLLPLLTYREFLHNTKGKLPSIRVRSVMQYGSETWPLKESDVSRIARTDMQMVWWMCHVSLKERKSSNELQNRLCTANIMDFLCQTRLRWFGCVERIAKENPVNNYRFIEVGGQTGKGRPCKTWTQLTHDDLRKLRLQSGLAQNQLAWRKALRETPYNPY